MQRARRRRGAGLRTPAGGQGRASYGDDLCVAMRVYFEKPRTTTGWKGMINDPAPGRLRGRERGPAHRARRLLLEVLDAGPARGLRVPRPDHARSTSPTPSPGARSAPAPPRARSTASSARACRCRWASRTAPTATCRWPSTPSAPRPAATPSPASTPTARPAILHTRGNPDCHVILRGGRDAPNYAAAAVAAALADAARGRPARAGGDRRLARQQRQGPRAPAGRGRATSAAQLAGGNRAIVGVMLESFLVAGAPGPGARASRSSTASRSPTPAWTGTPPWACSTSWPPPCGRRRSA